MESKPIEELLPQAGWSIYGLVRLASQRAVELAEGSPALITAEKDQKVTSIALNEIFEGKVVSKSVAKEFKPAKKEEEPEEEI